MVGSDRFGQPTVGEPEQFNCRWSHEETQHVDDRGTLVGYPIRIEADRFIPTGSIVWQGRLKDLPEEPEGLYEVASCDIIPDIKGRNPGYTVAAKKYKNTLNKE